ncbi:MAG: radical SAM protein [Spirochaetales bacterium]|uniref:FeMo cofactor biosynthesis protein NifB n=1 Tax=Candidatus Thalassospirochaeta sargassi TaxID=3119039 RepID=A0AAJ1IBM1_9SPIO|nr:radical SAM protein [Spirochaetales bacterium]
MNEALTKKHPCYDSNAAGKVARIHLPVAPKCNIQCKYCSRKYDCVNESRPGVTSEVLSPAQAVLYLEKVAEKIPIGVVGIAGPGDAFAEPEKTLETIRLCRAKFPDMVFCLSTNGLALPEHISELAASGVTHVTITINTLDPEVGKNIYSWARFEKRNYRGIDASRLLIDRQLESVQLLVEHGISVKINTILIPGVNEEQILPIAKMAKAYGCELMNIIPLIPVEGTVFENITESSCAVVESHRSDAQEFVRQSRHCKRCRADAVGILGEETDAEIRKLLSDASTSATGFTEERTKVAFVSREGVLVNQHLGEAGEFYIYEQIGDNLALSETREAPPAGTGERRWAEVAAVLKDCAYLLTSGAGDRPVKALGGSGINVLTIEGLAHDAASRLFRGEAVAHLKKRESCKAGNCGSGNGCG